MVKQAKKYILIIFFFFISLLLFSVSVSAESDPIIGDQIIDYVVYPTNTSSSTLPVTGTSNSNVSYVEFKIKSHNSSSFSFGSSSYSLSGSFIINMGNNSPDSIVFTPSVVKGSGSSLSVLSSPNSYTIDSFNYTYSTTEWSGWYEYSFDATYSCSISQGSFTVFGFRISYPTKTVYTVTFDTYTVYDPTPEPSAPAGSYRIFNSSGNVYSDSLPFFLTDLHERFSFYNLFYPSEPLTEPNYHVSYQFKADLSIEGDLTPLFNANVYGYSSSDDVSLSYNNNYGEVVNKQFSYTNEGDEYTFYLEFDILITSPFDALNVSLSGLNAPIVVEEYTWVSFSLTPIDLNGGFPSEYEPHEVASYHLSTKWPINGQRDQLKDPDNYSYQKPWETFRSFYTPNDISTSMYTKSGFVFFQPGFQFVYTDDPNTTYYGKMSLRFWPSNNSADVTGQVYGDGYNPLTNVVLLITNGDDPSSSTYQEFVIPEEWNPVIYLNHWNKDDFSVEYSLIFYFTLPDDYPSNLGFTPRAFALELEPISYSNYDGSWFISVDVNTYSGFGINSFSIATYQGEAGVTPPSLPPITDNTPSPDEIMDNEFDEEYKYIQKFYDDSSTSSALDVFNLSALQSSYSKLWFALKDNGNSFSFIFPSSGTVPFLNVVLWQQQEIPIKQYIDSMPSIYLTIIRFIVWFGIGALFISIVKGLISDLLGGGKH